MLIKSFIHRKFPIKFQQFIKDILMRKRVYKTIEDKEN